MLEFHNVWKKHSNGYESLKDVSFRAPPGQMMFVTGHSGAGKSTLLKIIAHLDTVTGGKVLINGHDLGKISAHALPFYRRQTGIVFQDHKLLNDLSVFENVALPLRITGVSSNEMQSRVRAALVKVGILDKMELKPEVLSAGEQQRVGIARAVARRPALILADEPTGNLDPALSREIINMLHGFNRQGVTVIVATHDENLINSSSFRVIELKNGELIKDNHAF